MTRINPDRRESKAGQLLCGDSAARLIQHKYTEFQVGRTRLAVTGCELAVFFPELSLKSLFKTSSVC